MFFVFLKAINNLCQFLILSLWNLSVFFARHRIPVSFIWKLVSLALDLSLMIVKKARKYNSEVVSSVLSVTTRRDKFGNDFFLVEFDSKELGFSYAAFENFSSVLDFINSNFKKSC